jgi:SNF2 family DNA or RNA helicase
MKRVDVDPATSLLLVKYKFRKKDYRKKLLMDRYIRGLENKTYSESLGVWICPASDRNVTKLFKWGFAFPDDWKETTGRKVPIEKVDVPPYLNIKVSDRVDFLYPKQKEAIQFLKYRKGWGLIGDDMGAGKTYEGLAWIVENQKTPNLIIVPAKVKKQWKEKIETVSDLDVEILYGTSAYPLQKKTYIINWDILYSWRFELKKIQFFCIIADECQKGNNKKSQMGKTLRNLVRNNTKSYVPMSGTPITKRPAQFFLHLNLLAPSEFDNEMKYLTRYCKQYNDSGLFTYNGATNIEELHAKVSRLMIRRNKREIREDMPSVFPPSIIDIPVKDLKIVKRMEREFFDSYKNNLMSSHKIEKFFDNLKLELFRRKAPKIIEWIEEFMESDSKLLVGIWHHEATGIFKKHFGDRASYYNGRMTEKEAERNKQAFYKDNQVMFINYRSGGVGLDGLQFHCSHALCAELVGAADTDQFIARLDRPGQEVPVNVYYPLIEGSLEEDYMEAMDVERRTLGAILDGVEMEQRTLLKELFDLRKKRG